MIPKHTIDQIFNESRVEEVIGDFLQLKKKGSDFWACCPFHNEKSPSFSVSPVKGIFKCFGCGQGGNSVDFLMKHEQLTYPEALRYLAQKYNIPIEEKELNAEQKELQSDRESLFVVTQFATTFFKEQLLNTDEGKSVGLGYFKQRGFSDEIIRDFELGYSPSAWSAFSDYALKQGYQVKFLLKSGLSKEKNGALYDTFRDRVLFPIHNISGRVIGFGARILSNEKKVAKYLNSPEHEIYEKSKIVYGIFQAKKEISAQQNCYLVEGYTDVLAMHQMGIHNVVASSGTSLTKDQIKLIKRYAQNITILYDGDFAGIKASFRGIDLILEEGMSVKVVSFPDGDDPDSFAKKSTPEVFKSYIQEKASDFIEFKAQALFEETKSDPFKKSEIIHQILHSISLIPDAITRSLYVKSSSKLLEVEEFILIQELNKLKRKAQNTQASSASDQAPIDLLLAPELNPLQHKQQEVIDRPTRHYERDVLRIMLTYGHQTIRFEKPDEDPSDVLVLDFLVHEIQKDDLRFQDELFHQMFQEFQAIHNQNIPNLLDYFYQHPREHIRILAIELTASKYVLSDWERKHIIVNTEEMLLKRAVFESLYTFKIHKIKQMIYEVEDILKQNPLDETDERQAIQKIMLLKDIHKRLNLEIGRPI